jgi:uncharacterized protein YbaR (Trm112 family)
MALSPDLLSVLCCPKCKGDLIYDDAGAKLTCPQCRLIYKIVDDIPDMLIENAEKF